MTRLANKTSRRKLSCGLKTWQHCGISFVEMLKKLQSIDIVAKENAVAQLFEAKMSNHYYVRDSQNYEFFSYLRIASELISILKDPNNMTPNNMFGYIKDEACLKGIDVYLKLNGPNILGSAKGRYYDDSSKETVTIRTIQKTIFHPDNYVDTSLPMSVVTDLDAMYDDFTQYTRKEKPSVSELQDFLEKLIVVYNELSKIPKDTTIYKMLVNSNVIDPTYKPEYKYLLERSVEIIDANDNIETVEYREIN